MILNYEYIKKQANDILKKQIAECSYIEYKKSILQRDKILKTICAYGNNYYDNDFQYLFIGVEEANSENDKAVPLLPITGIEEGALENCKNQLNSLRSFLYPNVSFEIITNEFEDKKYLLIVVPRQTGGPFMVSEKAENDKKIGLLPGRYIRIEAQSRLARVDEEYDLLRKFANFHFTSLTNQEATLEDLNFAYINEYVHQVSKRKDILEFNERDIVKALKLIDKNDPTETRVKNYAVLMFANNPEKFIPYSYVELIVDMYGTKRMMESRRFVGPIWKQYELVVGYINNSILSDFVIRPEGEILNRKVTNFPLVAIEELVANAIVHNNYENGKPIQIYISESQINIVNYNKPLPPLSLKDLNERRVFNERDTENPELREMFKALGIIESFGTGIGEAKRAMKENGSPKLYYKIFSESDNVTSVVIPVNEEYRTIKSGANKYMQEPSTEYGVRSCSKAIESSKHSSNVRKNLSQICSTFQDSVFGNSDIANEVQCSDTTATSYIKILRDELRLIVPVTGEGKGKFRFVKMA